MSWRQHAKCKGVNTALFFEDGWTQGKLAKALCDRCPVEDECLLDAIATEGGFPYGLRGGLTREQRMEYVR